MTCSIRERPQLPTSVSSSHTAPHPTAPPRRDADEDMVPQGQVAIDEDDLEKEEEEEEEEESDEGKPVKKSGSAAPRRKPSAEKPPAAKVAVPKKGANLFGA